MLRHRRLALESLEPRTVLSAAPAVCAVTVVNGELNIVGTKKADDIQVQMSGINVVVTANGQNTAVARSLVTADKLTVDLGAGNDQISVANDVPLSATIRGNKGNDVIQSGALNDFLFGDAGNDTIFGNDGDDTIDGGAGNDTMHGGNDTDLLFGDAGKDFLFGDDGFDGCYGGKGNDEAHGGGDIDGINGDEGNDLLFGDGGEDHMFGGAGNDTMHGGDDYDRIHGDAGNDLILGEGGDDALDGGLGNDRLNGGNGEDALFGNAGNDILNGDDSNDYLNGGPGKDTCNGGSGDDELIGELGADKLDGGTGNNLYDDESPGDTAINAQPASLNHEFEADWYISAGPSPYNFVGRVIAAYRVQIANSQLTTTLAIQFLSAPAAGSSTFNQTYDIRINGVVIGQINTDSTGTGEMNFSDDPAEIAVPFPGNFPTIAEGSTMQIGNFSVGPFYPAYYPQDYRVAMLGLENF